MNIEHYEHRTSIKFMVIEKSIKNLTPGRFVTQGKTRITLTDSEKKFTCTTVYITAYVYL